MPLTSLVAEPTDGPSLAHAPRWKRVLPFAVLAVVLVTVVVSDTAHAGLVWFLDVTEPMITGHPVGGAVLFIGLAALSAMLAFFSTAMLVPVALDAWGTAPTVALLWTGWMLGGMGAYGVGRRFGRPIVARLASEARLARYERWLSAQASFGFVLLFMLALQSEVPGYVLGLARYALSRFLLALALIEIPFAIFTVYVGAGLVERRLALLVGAGAAVVALSGTALLVLRKRFRP